MKKCKIVVLEIPLLLLLFCTTFTLRKKYHCVSSPKRNEFWINLVVSHIKNINGQDITNLHIPIVAGELENRNFFSLEIQSPRQGLRLYLGIRASVTALLSKMDDEFRRKKFASNTFSDISFLHVWYKSH